MAQFLTLSVLLLVAVFNPIVCPSSQMYNERRDRAPYIESIERSPQYLGDTAAALGGRLRKAPLNHKENIASYRSQEQVVTSTNITPENTNKPPKTDSVVETNIRTVFSTNFGPGLHIFPNTAPFNNQPHYNSYADKMIGDQPDPYAPPLSSVSSSAKDLFKIQRSPNGKLSLIYNEGYVPKDETDIRKNTDDHQGGGSSSGKESGTNRFETHFPGGHSLKKEKTETSTTVDRPRSKDSAIHFPTDEPEKNDNSYQPDITGCEGKLFCTNLRNYPKKSYVEQIIKNKFSNLESFFGEDFIMPLNISQRMNNEPDEEFLCRSRTRIIYPEAGVNKDYNWLVIVNVPSYRQGIRIEECISEGSTCGENNGISLPNRYTAYCKQSYIYRSLVALVANETIVKDQFKMPSCCKCVLKAV